MGTVNYLSVSDCLMQERAFLGVSTLKELVLKRPQGPEGTENFLQALLEVTMGNIELVSKSLNLQTSKKIKLRKWYNTLHMNNVCQISCSC